MKKPNRISILMLSILFVFITIGNSNALITSKKPGNQDDLVGCMVDGDTEHIGNRTLCCNYEQTECVLCTAGSNGYHSCEVYTITYKLMELINGGGIALPGNSHSEMAPVPSNSSGSLKVKAPTRRAPSIKLQRQKPKRKTLKELMKTLTRNKR